MKKIVVTGGMCLCDKGNMPLPLVGSGNIKIESMKVVLENDTPKGTFGICQILTMQAQGTPMPCQCAFIPPWEKSSNSLLVSGKKVVVEDSMLKCGIGGKIKILSTKNLTVKIEG